MHFGEFLHVYSIPGTAKSRLIWSILLRLVVFKMRRGVILSLSLFDGCTGVHQHVQIDQSLEENRQDRMIKISACPAIYPDTFNPNQVYMGHYGKKTENTMIYPCAFKLTAVGCGLCEMASGGLLISTLNNPGYSLTVPISLIYSRGLREYKYKLLVRCSAL